MNLSFTNPGKSTNDMPIVIAQIQSYKKKTHLKKKDLQL